MNDWKERLKQEYTELDERCNKLEKMLVKYKNGTLDFKPNCSYDLLSEQLYHMRHYREILKVRADIEGVTL